MSRTTKRSIPLLFAELFDPRQIPVLILRFLIAVVNAIKRVYIFKVAIDWLQQFTRALLLALSPSLSIRLRRRAIGHISRNAAVFFIGCGFGYLISYNLNSLASQSTGTFDGTDSSILYFNSDLVNKEIYTVWSPLYMGFSMCIVFLSVLYWRDIRRLADKFKRYDIEHDDQIRAMGALIIMLLIAAFFCQRYAYSILILAQSDSAKPLYWFLSRSQDKVYFNFAGIFYLSAIYFKLAFLFIALACCISVAIEWTRLVFTLAQRPSFSNSEIRLYSRSILACDRIYFYFQGLFIVLLYHNKTWGNYYIGTHGANVYVTQVFLFLCLLFFMALPRLYAKYEYQKDPVRYHHIFSQLGKKWEFNLVRSLIIAANIIIYFKLLLPLLENVIGVPPQNVTNIMNAVNQVWTAVSGWWIGKP